MADTIRESRTAIHTAFFRALESARKNDAVFRDPYAAWFLPPKYALLAKAGRVGVLNAVISKFIDKKWPASPRATLVVRTRLIDDAIAKCVSRGARQVVLLGAGYDTRSFRLRTLAGCNVFEVDREPTQVRKRDLLKNAQPLVRCARYVAVDFESEDLARELRRHGFDPEQLAVIVLEGVTNYLSAESVDKLFRELQTLLSGESTLIFTYVNKLVIDSPESVPGAAEQTRSVTNVGERWKFGIAPEQLEAYLAERGFRLLADVSAQEASPVVFSSRRRNEVGASYYMIAEAALQEREGEP